MTKKSKGFTLIELLVVISIIALLIGILLPALGQARRRAQMLQDVANLGEHGKAIGTYSAENRGRMPNLPEGTDRNDPSRAPGIPLGIWAGRDNETSPDSPSGGSPSAHNGWGFGQGALIHSDVWRFHNLAFGDYIIDGDGFELLSDIFASPATGTAGNYDAIKTGRSPDLMPFNRVFTSLANLLNSPGAYQSGQYGAGEGGQSVAGDENFMWALQSDYKYTFAALQGAPVNAGALGNMRSFWEGFSASGFGNANQFPWNDSNTYTAWRAYVQVAAFDFPTDKVAFWEHWAAHTRGADLYFEPKVDTAVAMVDGSAKMVRPFDVMPNTGESSDASKRGSFWGTQVHYLPGSGHGTQGVSQALGLNGRLQKPLAWFIMNDGGPRGRDLARTTVGEGG